MPFLYQFLLRLLDISSYLRQILLHVLLVAVVDNLAEPAVDRLREPLPHHVVVKYIFAKHLRYIHTVVFHNPLPCSVRSRAVVDRCRGSRGSAGAQNFRVRRRGGGVPNRYHYIRKPAACVQKIASPGRRVGYRCSEPRIL